MDRHLDSIRKSKQETHSFENACEKAFAFLESRAIRLDDFKDVPGYRTETIEKHKQYIKDSKENFRATDKREGVEEAKKMATLFEALLADMSSVWFGEDIYSIIPSEFDDFHNKIDSILEFREKDEKATYMALGMDATFSNGMQKKFEQIQKGIEGGSLSEVEYFSSEYTKHKGRMHGIPRVVISTDPETIKELGVLWAKKDTDSRALESLKRHPVKFQILEEMELQLEAFKKYAGTKGNVQALAAYQSAQKKVLELSRRLEQEPRHQAPSHMHMKKFLECLEVFKK